MCSLCFKASSSFIIFWTQWPSLLPQFHASATVCQFHRLSGTSCHMPVRERTLFRSMAVGLLYIPLRPWVRFLVYTLEFCFRTPFILRRWGSLSSVSIPNGLWSAYSKDRQCVRRTKVSKVKFHTLMHICTTTLNVAPFTVIYCRYLLLKLKPKCILEF